MEAKAGGKKEVRAEWESTGQSIPVTTLSEGNRAVQIYG